MIPSRPAAARPRAEAAFRVAGFPTRVRLTFPVLLLFIGWYPGVTVTRLAIWVAVAGAAVMWHELGHATAARRLGASPTIELYGFGGMTVWQPPADPTRGQLIGVSSAGPLAGFAVGALMAVGVAIAGSVGSGDVRYFVLVVLWTNVGWGLVNLLPVLPLDGGHILAELLPGDRATRHRRAAMVSVVVAGVAMVWLLVIGVLFGALVLGWIVMSNFSSLNASRSAQQRSRVEEQAVDALQRLGHGDPAAMVDVQQVLAGLRPHSAPFRAIAIETAAATGNGPAARELLDSAPVDEPVQPGLYALVFAAESAGRDGVDELIEIFRREPVGRHVRWMAIALRWGGRLGELAAIIGSTGVPVDDAVLAEAAAVAEGLGDPAAARAVRALGGG